MRSPNKRPLGEIVREVVDEIKPDGYGEEAAVAMTAWSAVNGLRELDCEIADRGAAKRRVPICGRRQENAEDLAAIRKHVVDLQKALRKAGGTALLLLFSGQESFPDELPRRDAQAETLQRIESATAMLATIRARCDLLLKERPGEHASADFRQRRVAHEAGQILKLAGKEPHGGTMDSLYGRIASLLYEAVTGEAGRDLQWACKAALRNSRDDTESEQPPAP